MMRPAASLEQETRAPGNMENIQDRRRSRTVQGHYHQNVSALLFDHHHTEIERLVSLLRQSRPGRSLSSSPTHKHRAITEADVQLANFVGTPRILSLRPRRRSSMPNFPRQERSFLQSQLYIFPIIFCLTKCYFQDAWHSISTVDPLADSDEEGPGEQIRREYSANFILP